MKPSSSMCALSMHCGTCHLHICAHQTTLLGEGGAVGLSGGGGSEALRSKFESKINTASRDREGGHGAGRGKGASQSVRNDIKKSEKSGEKVSKHTGRDDRATVEQVRRLKPTRRP